MTAEQVQHQTQMVVGGEVPRVERQRLHVPVDRLLVVPLPAIHDGPEVWVVRVRWVDLQRCAEVLLCLVEVAESEVHLSPVVLDLALLDLGVMHRRHAWHALTVRKHQQYAVKRLPWRIGLQRMNAVLACADPSHSGCLQFMLLLLEQLRCAVEQFERLFQLLGVLLCTRRRRRRVLGVRLKNVQKPLLWILVAGAAAAARWCAASARPIHATYTTAIAKIEIVVRQLHVFLPHGHGRASAGARRTGARPVRALGALQACRLLLSR
mmetsp:Transcript_38596/g.114615  ORF Transcript_38596/g.114615 Transcript_38596/m.114615 type:complete len:266 (+) Transcript_38596:1592-2389(+)